jgi:hypothetical protein
MIFTIHQRDIDAGLIGQYLGGIQSGKSCSDNDNLSHGDLFE